MPSIIEAWFRASEIMASSDPNIVSKNERYITYRTGVVFDKKTGLEWYPLQDTQTTWHDAKRWVRELRIDGGGWRMPSVKELKAIYEKGRGPRNMPSGIRTTGWYIWSGQRVGGEPAARGFDFSHGQSYSYDYAILDTSGDTTWYDGSGSTSARAFAVRSKR